MGVRLRARTRDEITVDCARDEKDDNSVNPLYFDIYLYSRTCVLYLLQCLIELILFKDKGQPPFDTLFVNYFHKPP